MFIVLASSSVFFLSSTICWFFDLDLISIRKPNQKSTLKRLLEMTRKPEAEALTLEEITAEVKIVRKEMYNNKKPKL